MNNDPTCLGPLPCYLIDELRVRLPQENPRVATETYCRALDTVLASQSVDTNKTDILLQINYYEHI